MTERSLRGFLLLICFGQCAYFIPCCFIVVFVISKKINKLSIYLSIPTRPEFVSEHSLILVLYDYYFYGFLYVINQFDALVSNLFSE